MNNNNTLTQDIINILEKQTTPISIHDLVVALNKYEVYDIKTELWSLAADGKIRFTYDWKITKSNDGAYF